MNRKSTDRVLVFDLPQRVFRRLFADCFFGAWSSAGIKRQRIGFAHAAAVMGFRVWPWLATPPVAPLALHSPVIAASTSLH
jgi:hypothetical protein